MALTPEEEKELAALDAKDVKSVAPTSNGLSPEEQAELSALDQRALSGGLSNDQEQYEEYVPTENVQHPKISIADRLLIKNFGAGEDSPDTIAYLKAQYPKMEAKSTDGYLSVRMPGEPSFKRVDPSPTAGLWSAIKDAPLDLLDISSDIGAGAAESVGGALGGLAALGTGAIPAVVPAFMAGSGVTGAAAEMARQGLGKLTGVRQGFNKGDMAIAGAGAATIPLVGAVAAKAAKKVAPTFLSFLSGIPKDVIKGAYKRLKELDALDERGAVNYATDIRDKLITPLLEGSDKVGAELASEITNAGGKVSIKNARAPLKQLIEDYVESSKGLDNKPMSEAVEELKKHYDDLFNLSSPKDVTDEVGPLLAKMSPEERAMFLSANGMKEQIEKVSSQVPLEGIHNFGRPVFQNAESTVPKYYQTSLPDEITPKAAWDLQQQLKTLAGMYKLGPQTQAMSPRMSGKIPTSGKREILALDEVYDLLGQGIAGAAENSPKLRAKYADFLNTRKAVNNAFRNDQTSFQTLKNLNGTGKLATRQMIENAEKNLGVSGVLDGADLLNIWGYLGDTRPGGIPYSAYSRGGVTSTSATLAGGMLGDAAGSVGESLFDVKSGRPIMRFVGALGGSPAMTKKYIRAAHWYNNTPDFNPWKAGLRAGGYSLLDGPAGHGVDRVWSLLNEKQKQENEQ